MKRIVLWLLPILAISCSYRNITAVCDPSFKTLWRGIVSLTFDDGKASAYEVAVPLLSGMAQKGTFYIFTDGLGEKSFINSGKVKKIQDNENEIGTHGKTHKRFPKLSKSEILNEIIRPRTELAEMGVKPISTFAYPWGEFTDYSIEQIKNSGYISARTTVPGLNDCDTDRYMLKAFLIENWMTFDMIRVTIDQAVENHKWLILVFHEIQESDYRYSISIRNFYNILSYLDKNHTQVFTVKEVLDIYNQNNLPPD